MIKIGLDSILEYAIPIFIEKEVDFPEINGLMEFLILNMVTSIQMIMEIGQ